MLYAILAYHDEAHVMSWTPEEDAALMGDLQRAHDRVNEKSRLGPAARLGGTKKARTLRGPGAGVAIDGPPPTPGPSTTSPIVVHTMKTSD